MSLSRLVSVALFGLIALSSLPLYAQQSTLNVLCVWQPHTSPPNDYEIHVLRPPSGTVHVIADPAITTAACTNDPIDLQNWVMQDLQSNGSYNINSPSTNDQLHTAQDIFCPGTPQLLSIASMMATMNNPAQSGAPQAALVVRATCEGSQGGGGGNAPQPTMTYAVNACRDGEFQVEALFYEPKAVKLTKQRSFPNQTAFQTELVNGLTPVQSTTFSSTVNHCDPSAMQLAQDYIQSHIGSLTPQDFDRDVWSCPAGDLTIYVDSCQDNGLDATYGYQIYCCPQPVSNTGTNCFSGCISPENSSWGASVAQVTYGLGPSSPLFHDPNTFCQDISAAATSWFNTTMPGGNPPCGINWGASQGGWYIQNTYSTTSCSVTPNDANCMGYPRYHYCHKFACEPK